ncbi:MAG: hypothetical protein E7604_03485 [Ruminococcaceae bacterium]|nr:hypothetical protein [Oscillospiraceae bacterium]
MKRTLALLLTALLLATLPSCNNTDTPDIDSTQDGPVAVDHVWRSEYIHYPENVRGTPDPYTLDGDLLTFSGTHVVSEEPYQTEPVTLTFHLKTHEFTVTPIETAEEEQTRWAQYDLPYEGGAIRLYSEFNENTHEESYTLCRVDGTDAVLWEIDAKAQFEQLSGDRPWFYINDVLQNSTTGTVYLCSDQNIAAISPDGKRLYEIALDNYLDNIFSTGDGTVYTIFYEFDPITGSGGSVMKPINDAAGSLGEAVTLPETVQIQNADIHTAPGYDLFYSNDTGLYGWNIGEAEPTLICNWINSDMTANNARNLTLLSDALALRTDYDPVTGEPQLCIMTPMPPEEVVPKYLIEVAYSENGSNEMQGYAVAFNRESEKYRVVLKDYSSYYDDSGTAADVLNREIMAGDIPDIIVDSGNIFDMDNLAEKGLFCDLYSFMDAPGALMTRDDFLPCVLAPFEAENASLPVLVSGFSLRTLYGYTDVVGDRQLWTLDDILTLQNTLSPEQYLFSMYISTDPEHPTDPGMQMLTNLLPYSLSAFIDRENGTCSFDDGRFAALLQFCQSCPILNAADLENGTGEKFRDGTLVLKEESHLYEISDYLKTKYYDFGGEGMAVIGYPTADPNAVSGTAIQPHQKYAITADSNTPDGAWEFIMRTFGDPGEDFYYHRSGFPSARAALDRMFEEESRNYYVFRENGWSGTSIGENEEFNLEDQTWLQDEIASGGVFGHMSEEDEAELRTILDSITLVADTDTEIMELIREDASAYFAGAKSLDETVKIIQSRVSIYVSEHS